MSQPQSTLAHRVSKKVARTVNRPSAPDNPSISSATLLASWPPPPPRYCWRCLPSNQSKPSTFPSPGRGGGGGEGGGYVGEVPGNEDLCRWVGVVVGRGEGSGGLTHVRQRRLPTLCGIWQLLLARNKQTDGKSSSRLGPVLCAPQAAKQWQTNK